MIASPHIIRARGLTKNFGEFCAVDHIDFDVTEGECVGFLGPNGAGKTTTIQMMTCYSPVTSGEISVLGLDVRKNPREIKFQCGICPQQDNLDPDFDVRTNLLTFGRYFDLPKREAQKRADELLEFFELSGKAASKIDTLSGGMKRRLVLARALLNTPKVLILDEPTTGLDPQARQLIWGRVRQLKAKGVTVVLTTHYMEEAHQLCDRVILMNHGKILLEGRPQELVQREIGREVLELWDLDPKVRQFIRTHDWKREETDDRVFIFIENGNTVSQTISDQFPHQQRLLRHATLEDVFLRHAGRALRE